MAIAALIIIVVAIGHAVACVVFIRRQAAIESKRRHDAPTPGLRGIGRWLEERLSDLIGSMGVRFVGGVFVLAAPAYYAFAPPQPAPFSRLGYVRAVIMVVWLALVAVSVFVASGHDIAVDRLAARERHQRTEWRELAAVDILRRVLLSAEANAQGYEWALYVPLRDGDRIGPMPGLSPEEAGTWARYESVTGTAWASKTWTKGVGDELKDGGKYAVNRGSPTRELQVVVANPVFNAEGEVIAVLTAVSEQNRPFLLTEDGQKLHVQLSTDIGRVLIDVLGYEE